MTTIITEKPYDGGRATIKSMAKSSQICYGIGRGCNSPTGEVVDDLACWHIKQCWT